jgi:hypothetical protein
MTNCESLSCHGTTYLTHVSLDRVTNFVINETDIIDKKIKTNSKGEVKIYNEADLIA